MGNLSQSYGVSLAAWDHLPPDIPRFTLHLDRLALDLSFLGD